MTILEIYTDKKSKEERVILDISFDSICMIRAIIEDELENGVPCTDSSIDKKVTLSLHKIIQEITEYYEHIN